MKINIAVPLEGAKDPFKVYDENYLSRIRFNSYWK